jgi:hypothetical protein
VTFTPTAAGARVATITILDDTAKPRHVVALSGTGASTGQPFTIALGTHQQAPASLPFGSQALHTTSAARTITLQAMDSTPVAITAITLATEGDFALNDAACVNHRLSPGASCSLTVTFTPTAAGARVATITILDDTANPRHLIALTGTGQ